MSDATAWIDPELVAAGKLKIVNVAKEEEVLFRNLNEPADLGEALVTDGI